MIGEIAETIVDDITRRLYTPLCVRSAAIDAPVHAEGKEINCLLTFAGEWTRARIDANDPF